MLSRILTALLLVAAAVAGVVAQEPAQGDPPTKTKTTNSVWRPLPGDGHFVHFTPRELMKQKRSPRAAQKLDPSKLPPAPATLDYAKDIAFPMDLNDTYGDCYYAAICHLFNTLMGNSSTSPTFGLGAIRSRYFSLSGGDNGLGDEDVQGEMTQTTRRFQGYVADVPGTSIVDFQYLDTTDTESVKRAMNAFGVVVFTLSVPNGWINNSNTGAIWDAPARANPMNGHAVIWNGYDNRGYYKLQTWGTFVWITPAGVKQCDPSGWVVFSTKWFDAKGYAPNKMHITQLAKVWQDAGGKAIPASVVSQFPPPDGPTPPTPPGPTPGVTITLSADLKAGTYSLGGTQLSRDMTLGQLLELVSKGPAPMASPHDKRIEELERNQTKIVDAVLKLQEMIQGKKDAQEQPEKKTSRRWSDLTPAEQAAWWRRNFPEHQLSQLIVSETWERNWASFERMVP